MVTVTGEMKMNSETKAVLANVDVEEISDRLEGQNSKLRASKPQASGDNGLIQYVWRMARHHSGADPSMPVTASWWLQDWLDSQSIDASVSGIMDDNGKEITSALEAVTDEVLDELGLPTTGAAEAWAGVI